MTKLMNNCSKKQFQILNQSQKLLNLKSMNLKPTKQFQIMMMYM